MDPLLLPWAKPLQHVSTLVRQFLFDFIFITENCVLLAIAVNSNIVEIQVGSSLVMDPSDLFWIRPEMKVRKEFWGKQSMNQDAKLLIFKHKC